MTRPIDLPPPPVPDPHCDPLASAVVALVNERGADAGDPAEVARRAGVSREEFDERFSGFDDCLVDSFGRFATGFERSVGLAFNDHDDWRTSLRAAAYTTADWLSANPELARFGTVGVMHIRNEMVRVRREQIAAFCGRLIERGREASPDPSQVPEAADLMTIGSIFHLLTQRMQEEAEVDFHEMVPPMMYLAVQTYIGDEEAEEELSLPRP